MNCRFILTLTFFFAPLSSVVCQSNQDVIETLNVRYERFKNDVTKNGTTSSKSVESFIDLLNYFNGVSNDNTIGKEAAYRSLSYLYKWEHILDDINNLYGRDFFMSLNRAAVEHNELSTKEKYPYTEEELVSLYDGGQQVRDQKVVDKCDLYLSLYFHKAYQYARLHDMDNIVSNVSKWFEVSEKWLDTYPQLSDYHRCVLLLAKWLSATMLNEGLRSQASSLLFSIINNFIGFENKPDILDEAIEDATTWAIHLIRDVDPEFAIEYTTSPVIFGYDLYYDINNYLDQLSIYIRLMRDVDSDKSLEVAKKAERLIEMDKVGKNGRHITREMKGGIYNELSQSYLRKQQYAEQLDAIKNAVEADGDHVISAHVHNLAGAYYSNGEIAKALDTYHILEEKGIMNASTYSNMALIAYQLRRFEECNHYEEMYYTSITSDFLNQVKYMPPRDREMYLLNAPLFGALYEGIASIAFGNPFGVSLAYNSSLFQKGLLVRMNVITSRRIFEHGPEELKKAYTNYLLGMASDDDNLANEAHNTMLLSFPEFFDFSVNDYTVEWEDVWACLSDKEVAIEFVTFVDIIKEERRIAALILGKDYDQPKMVDLCSYKEFRDLFKATDGYGCPRIYNQLEKPSQLLWGPLMEYLSGIETIYYSPCIGLSQINLDILTAGAGNKPMNQVFNMRRMLSTAGLVDRKAEEKLESAYLVGGVDYGSAALASVSNAESFRGFNNKTGWDPLGTMSEVESIQKSCHKKMKVSMLTGANVEESDLKKRLVKSPSILHIATHGFYMEEKVAHKYAFYSEYEDKWIPDGLRSGVILSGSNDVWLGKRKSGGNDGTLTADEINGLDLSGTELVVLSACQTGLGEYNAEGTYGLMRAFKNAGAGSIVMSLWEVNDEATTLFMTTFYSRLVSGKDRYEAFFNAQEAVKKKYPSPNCWAAFVMLD